MRAIADIGRRLVGVGSITASTLRALGDRLQRSARCRRPRAGAIRRAARGCRARNATRPGITLTAPGSASSRPTVATRSCSEPRARFDREDHLRGRGERVLAQHPSARRRRGLRDPRRSRQARRAVDRDRPCRSRRFSASSTGPCSICSSTKRVDAARAQLSTASRDRRRRRRALRSSVTPSLSLRDERGLRREAGERARSRHRGREAHPLLVAEGDDVDRDDRSRSPAAASCSTTASAASAPRLPS